MRNKGVHHIIQQKDDARSKISAESVTKKSSNTFHKRTSKIKRSSKSGIKGFYENNYKVLMIIPFLLVLLAFGQIFYQYSTTGDFINKGVSLKGGFTITIASDAVVVGDDLEVYLLDLHPNSEISVREIKSLGVQTGIIIEASTDINPRELITQSEAKMGPIDSTKYSIEEMGSTLGESFFWDLSKAVVIAFVLMGAVIFIVYRNFVPSIAVILAAFSDMVVTLSIINLMGIRVSSASIAAFLMLIGYSVDTDILLTSRVLRKKTGTVMERIYGAMKTGLTMTCATLIALTLGLIFSESETIKQIMLILFTGLLVDLVYTWFQNVGILRIYMEKKAKE